MAKVPMSKVKIYGLKERRSEVLKKMQSLGVVEVCDAKKKIGKKYKDAQSERYNSDVFEETQKAISVLSDSLNAVSNAIDLIYENLSPAEKKHYNAQGAFYEPIRVSASRFNSIAKKSDSILKVSYDILSETKMVSQKEAEVLKLKSNKEELLPWKALDVPTSISSTRKVSCFVGTLPALYDSEDSLLEALSGTVKSRKEHLHLEIFQKDENFIYVFGLCRKEYLELFLNDFLRLGFVSCKYCCNNSPSKEIDEIDWKISKLEREVKDLKNKIARKKYYLRDLRCVHDYYLSKLEGYKVVANLYNTARVFVLSGYVPKIYEKKLHEAFDAYECVFVEFEDVKAWENSPVFLKNLEFSSAVEPVLESYSLPSKVESDPTTVMSIFYYILFGLMLSDAGYGAIMSLVCGGLLLKFKNIKASFKKSLTMFFICGLSTVFWGLMFGSIFGDAVEVISSTFFGKLVHTPTLWFVPIKNPMFMLSFSFGLGILHMFTGLFLKLLQLVRLKKYKDALFDVVPWFLLVGGLILYLLSVPLVPKLLSLNFVVSASVAEISKVCMLLGALTILFTSGREGGGIFKKLMKGVYGLYGVTNYLSDIISYSRLLALGLSTGVIAQVFNRMAAMGGNTTFGLILFVVVFVIGHTVNVLINLLGAYVHTNRLQFVEFFSKFYEGGGKKFSPFAFKTKYCNFFGGVL